MGTAKKVVRADAGGQVFGLQLDGASRATDAAQTYNHISGTKSGVAGTYNRSPYAREKKQALDMWAEGERLTGHPGLPLEPTPNLAAAE